MSDQLAQLHGAITDRLDALHRDHARLSCALDFGDLLTVSRIEDNAEALLNLARDARILLSPAGVCDAAKRALLFPAPAAALRQMGSGVAA